MLIKQLGKKFESAAQLKECLTYYALANGYSIWYERSAADQIIVVFGQRPPHLKEATLGKQRKQFKYPNESKEDIPKCSFRLYARMNSEKTFQLRL